MKKLLLSLCLLSSFAFSAPEMGISDVYERINALITKTAELETKVSSIDTSVSSMNNRQMQWGTYIVNMQSNLSQLRNEFSGYKTFIDGKLSSLNNGVVQVQTNQLKQIEAIGAFADTVYEELLEVENYLNNSFNYIMLIESETTQMLYDTYYIPVIASILEELVNGSFVVRCAIDGDINAYITNWSDLVDDLDLDRFWYAFYEQWQLSDMNDYVLLNFFADLIETTDAFVDDFDSSIRAFLDDFFEGSAPAGFVDLFEQFAASTVEVDSLLQDYPVTNKIEFSDYVELPFFYQVTLALYRLAYGTVMSGEDEQSQTDMQSLVDSHVYESTNSMAQAFSTNSLVAVVNSANSLSQSLLQLKRTATAPSSITLIPSFDIPMPTQSSLHINPIMWKNSNGEWSSVLTICHSGFKVLWGLSFLTVYCFGAFYAFKAGMFIAKVIAMISSGHLHRFSQMDWVDFRVGMKS